MTLCSIASEILPVFMLKVSWENGSKFKAMKAIWASSKMQSLGCQKRKQNYYSFCLHPKWVGHKKPSFYVYLSFDDGQ